MDTSSLVETRSFRIPRWTRNKNVVVISGPQGCGKSATVLAVARELDFEIFEINSGSRRSGKDIQDKVGDMTANHLVNHKRNDAPTTGPVLVQDEDEISNATVQKDIDSGRQGTMMNFFKAKPISASKPVRPAKAEQEPNPTNVSSTQTVLPLKQSSKKSQKQSLILFEEADILFEEDQQFWTQVIKLASHSKRPIIVTCNDERQIPVQDLPLAALLRLRPAPIDLASNYMLALAGREGHILDYEPVVDLYLSRNCDLRASISELDFWCQMSVGDRKGGLEWMYQRWPPGKDTDAEGRLLRVASEGTFRSGMGVLSHDTFESSNSPSFDKEEELMSEVWRDWGVSPSAWSCPSSVPAAPSVFNDNIKDLEDIESYTEALSSVDMYCRVALPSYEHNFSERTDPTEPMITRKSCLSYTLAAPLLQVDHQSDFSELDTTIYIQTLLRAEQSCGKAPMTLRADNSPRPTSEYEYTRRILKKRAEKAMKNTLTRVDFSSAFDILADPPDATLPGGTSFNLTASSFDRSFRIITHDLAPYVRSIVAHEQVLEEQRIRLSNLLSQGGNGKRQRTTRASRVAIEGGARETKRRERWFDEDLGFAQVMATAGPEWAGLGWKGERHDAEEGTCSLAGSTISTQDSSEVHREVAMTGTEEE